MLGRLFGVGGPTSLGFLGFPQPQHDQISPTSKYAEEIKQHQQSETGKQRLYLMFSTDEFGNTSPEVVSVLQAGMLGLFTGACIGGFVESRLAYMNFMERNQATAFKNHIDAKKKLQDQVTVNFGKGAFKWGWRLGLFSSSYVLISTTIAVYRGRSGILEYVAAGGITGATYKSNLGVRGLVVGGVLGSVLGGVAGAISLAVLRLTGTTMEEVRFWQYEWKTSRQDAMQRAMKAHKDQDEDPLILHHDLSGKSLSLEAIPDQQSSPDKPTT